MKQVVLHKEAIWATFKWLRVLVTGNSKQHMLPPFTSGKDIETETDLHPMGFQEIIKDFSSLADKALLDIEGTFDYAWTTRSICDLFDFMSDHWVKEHGRKRSHPLDKELTCYEFLSNHKLMRQV
jgi:hypothetical protein